MYPKSIESLPKSQKEKIHSISDERNNGDGWWIYLTKEYADFDFDPFNPMRSIHEQKLSDCISRLKRAQRVTEDDFKKYPMLQR